ncbi:class I SAM-dependent methyltransferase [Streptomyces hoynatensis]|uniref:Class I SAM-dependent methyltransferase n=1 Tax=Streptomyces hoynatensis TaxID=1141874 RepID=A0A3A9Z348_9ACTN|nr:class I SAM-dependent methyltransferase [Streptomyces hoynatensis]RKN42912.1 class I SAM-dependent methyltransferase [Streptomyces hoynatensis]
MNHAQLATSFNAIAAEYAASRPGYPPALYDAVEELAGRAFRGADVLDIGAGTGLGTRPMWERGARVTAAEPGPGMAAQLRAGLPGIRLVRASGDALPFAGGSFDLVTYAQAWHWTDPLRSLPEALRVLRPGGALATWWNTPDRSVAWRDAQERRLRERLPSLDGRPDRTRLLPELVRSHAPGVSAHYREVPWHRTVPLATHLANLATHSHISVLAPGERAALLAEEEAALLRVFPDARVREDYRVRLSVAVRPRG